MKGLVHMSSRTPGRTKSYKVVHYPVNHTPCKFIQAQRICKNTLPNVKKMQESIVQQTRCITHSTNKIKHNKRTYKKRVLPFRDTVLAENMFTAKENRNMHLFLADGTHITGSDCLQ